MIKDISSYYMDNILYYLCGFTIKKKSISNLNCEECINLLMRIDDNLNIYIHFTDFLLNEKLIRASSALLKIIKFMYHMLIRSDSKLLTKTMIISACKNFGSTVFKKHISNNDFF